MRDLFKFITRLDNIVLLACLILMGAVVCYGENGPEPKVFVGTGEITDSSVTPAKLDPSGDYSVNSVTLADKVQATWADIRGDIHASGSLKISGGADIGGDITGVNASFTGNVEVSGDVIAGGTEDAGDYPMQASDTLLIRADTAGAYTQVQDFTVAATETVLLGTSFAHRGETTLWASSLGHVLIINSAGAHVSEKYLSGGFSTTKDTAGKINVYFDTNTNKLTLQNLYGSSQSITIKKEWFVLGL